MSTAVADSAAPARTGIALIVAGVLAMSVNDMLIKFLSGGYALHEIVLIRSLTAMVVITAILASSGGLAQLRSAALGLQALRALCLVLANVTFFMGLAVLPLAEATAIFFVSPLIITLLSAVFLREPVGPRRWAAVLTGFLGVLVVVGPELRGASGAGLATILPGLAALCYAATTILTRRLKDRSGPWAMAFCIQAAFIVTSLAVGLAAGDGKFLDLAGGNGSLEFVLRAWIWPSPRDLGLILLIGAVTGFVSFAVSQAYRLGPAATIAPFEYAYMPFAVVWGIVVFGDLPGRSTWAGLILIAGAGLYVFARENRRGVPVGRPARRA